MSYTSKMDGPGDLFQLVAVPGLPINMATCEAVSFVTFHASGNQVVTVSESIAGASKQDLAVIDTVWKAPGIGGTWTQVTQTAAASFTHADATNDMAVFTVTANSLSAGYTHLEWTSTGTANMAVLHGLREGSSAVTADPPVATALEIINGAAVGWFDVNNVDGVGTVATSSTQEFSNLVDLEGDKATRGSTTGSDTNDPSINAAGSEAIIRLSGVAGNSVSVPDAAPLDITGDIDIRVKVAMDDWTPAAASGLASKRGAAGQVSWALSVGTDGVLTMSWSEDGTAVQTADSTAATGVTDGATAWIRVTVDVDDGASDSEFLFYTSDDDGETWDQLGDAVASGAATSIFSSTAAVHYGVGTAAGADPVAGDFYRGQLYNGIDGTKVVDIDVPTDNSAAAQTTFTATTGGTATINRSATGLKAVAVAANKSLVQFDGTDDYIQLPASCTPTFTPTTGAFTVLVCHRRFGDHGGPSTASLFSSESAVNNGLFLYMSIGTTPRALVGGATTQAQDAAAVNADGAIVVEGGLVDTGFVTVYSAGALGATPADITGVGAITHLTPRVGSKASLVNAPLTEDVFSVLMFQAALTEAEMQAIDSHMQTLA